MQPGRREDAPPPAQGPGPGRPPGDGGASGGHPPARGRWGLAFSGGERPPFPPRLSRPPSPCSIDFQQRDFIVDFLPWGFPLCWNRGGHWAHNN